MSRLSRLGQPRVHAQQLARPARVQHHLRLERFQPVEFLFVAQLGDELHRHALAVVLMVLDHRNGWLWRLRYTAAAVVEPVYRLAGLPAVGVCIERGTRA